MAKEVLKAKQEQDDSLASVLRNHLLKTFVVLNKSKNNRDGKLQLYSNLVRTNLEISDYYNPDNLVTKKDENSLIFFNRSIENQYLVLSLIQNSK